VTLRPWDERVLPGDVRVHTLDLGLAKMQAAVERALRETNGLAWGAEPNEGAELVYWASIALGTKAEARCQVRLFPESNERTRMTIANACFLTVPMSDALDKKPERHKSGLVLIPAIWGIWLLTGRRPIALPFLIGASIGVVLLVWQLGFRPSVWFRRDARRLTRLRDALARRVESRLLVATRGDQPYRG
jgi:hypothetical protein